jgi:glycosyltransferase involved in cell wall biosynthesis
MSFGTPILVSPEVKRVLDVEDSGAGWMRPGEEVGELLRRLGSDGDVELEARGRAARELAKRYEWDGVAEQYEDAYKAVLRSRESVR